MSFIRDLLFLQGFPTEPMFGPRPAPTPVGKPGTHEDARPGVDRPVPDFPQANPARTESA